MMAMTIARTTIVTMMVAMGDMVSSLFGPGLSRARSP
jgi:hypothetical protein